MPLLSFQNHEILFIHIPKTGGTSVENFFLENGFRMRLFARRHNPCLKVNPQHLTSSEVHYLLGDGFDYEFAVIRDPFDRIESEFFYTNKMRARRQLPNLPEESFSQWVLDSLEEAGGRPYFRDGHFRPQAQFVSAATNVFRYEDGLTRAVERVFEETNIPMDGTLPMHNKSDRRPLSWTSEALDMVREFYAEDFLCFGYPDRA